MAKNSKAVVFVLLVTIGMFFTIFAFVAQQTSGQSSGADPAASCVASQYATGENSSGGFQCKQVGYQELTNTPVINSGSCSNLNLYVTAITTTTANCARVNQGFNQTGLTLYTQIDEGQNNKIYDLSGEGAIGIANNQSSKNWLSDSSCIFQQFCWLNNATSKNYITLGHDYNDSGNNQITMCLWFFPTVTSGSSPYVFGDLLVFRGYSVNTNNAGNAIRAQRDTTTGTSIPVTVSTWNFACISYTFFSISSNWVNLFLNGKLVSTFNDSTSIPNSGIGNYTIGNTPKGISGGANFFGGRDSAFYQFNYPLSNSSVLALYEYVPNPTEQSPVLWQQLTGFPSNCPAGQAVIGLTSTLSCTSFLTTQTPVTTEMSATCPANQYATGENGSGFFQCTTVQTQTSQFFSYGTCPANQFATAITTTTLNCGAVSTEAIASCSTGQYATSESANGGFACGNDNITFQNSTKTCSDVTSGTTLMAGFKLNYTSVGTGQVYVSINFQVTSPATINLNTKYRLAFGTGNAPACNAAQTGTKIGNLFNLDSYGGSAATAFVQTTEISLTVGVLTLTPGTTYWFDIQMLDSSTATWIYNTPQLAVMES